MTALALAWMLACGPAPLPEEAPPAQVDNITGSATVAPEPEAEAEPGVTAGTPSQAVPVELTFFNITPFYKGLFATRERVLALGEGLGGCLTDNAQVHVSYNNETRIGKVMLKVPPGVFSCPTPHIDGGVDLSALEPLGVALSEYRGDIAAKADIRIQSFQLGLTLTRGTRVCDVMLGGVKPEDGTRFHPCVSMAGEERCARGETDAGVQRFVFDDAEAASYLQACFQ